MAGSAAATQWQAKLPLKQYRQTGAFDCMSQIQVQPHFISTMKRSSSSSSMDWKEYPRASVEADSELAAWPKPVVKAVVLTPLALFGGSLPSPQWVGGVL
jgi:hypothetical protein